jgi:hypothetical protein
MLSGSNLYAADLQRVDTGAFLPAAFELADVVVRARVDGSDAVVLEELRGFHVAKRAPLRDAPPMCGEVWLAGSQCNGASPDLSVIAWLPATVEHQRLVRQWAKPGWQQTPIVAVVKIVAANIDHIVFEVVRTLKGKVAGPRLYDNAWRFEKFMPLAPGPQQYVLAAWTTIGSSGRGEYPSVAVRSLTRVAPGLLTRVQADLKQTVESEPHHEPVLAALRRAWTFHRAPLVVETGAVLYHEPIPTNCGGSLFTLVPRRWLRGSATTLATDIGDARPSWPPCGLNELEKKCAEVAVTPFAFAGCSGGCYCPTVDWDGEYLAAGSTIGAKPLALVKLTAAARDDVARALDEREPRFFARPSRSKAMARPPRDPDFEPPFELRDLGQLGTLSVTRFEVVERGEGWLRCRGLEEKDGEWFFEGLDLPSWGVGDRLAGHWLSDAESGTLGRAPRLFLPNLFVRADENLELLQWQADQVTRWRAQR